MKIENTYFFRRFLLCDMLAKACSSAIGFHVHNFASCVLDENLGQYRNERVDRFFYAAEDTLAEIGEDDTGIVFAMNHLEGVSIETLSLLTEQELSDYCREYLIGNIKL